MFLKLKLNFHIFLFFRVSQNISVSKGHTLQSVRRIAKEELWKHSREPLRLPLLQKVAIQDDLAVDACYAFSAILKYMGDLPSVRSRIGNEYTDIIFESPLKHVRIQEII